MASITSSFIASLGMTRATSICVVIAVGVMPLPICEVGLVLSFQTGLVAQPSIAHPSGLVVSDAQMSMSVPHPKRLGSSHSGYGVPARAIGAGRPDNNVVHCFSFS